ncbi:MAG: ABC transporter permease [Clostridia bacterium]|nr:ABC transporter permease [Clostridia bacterium]
MKELFTLGLFQNTLRTATPVVLAAIGILMTDHVGIMNIGMDGMMLCGAFFAVLGSVYLGGWVGGLMLALLVGLILGIFFGVFVVKLKADEYIIGMALNIFAGGLTVYLLRSIFGVAGAFSGSKELPITALPKINIPLLQNIPVLGDLLSGNTLLVYVSWLTVILAWVVIYRTPWGFHLRAAGEHPESLRAAGQSPERMKLMASVICGLFSGLAGAHLSLGYLTMFTENMSAARGFIAVACVIFGGSNPPYVFLAALLFGFIDALGLRVQSFNISSNLTSLAPYLVTVLMMIWVTWRAERKKKALGKLK